MTRNKRDKSIGLLLIAAVPFAAFFWPEWNYSTAPDGSGQFEFRQGLSFSPWGEVSRSWNPSKIDGVIDYRATGHVTLLSWSTWQLVCGLVALWWRRQLKIRIQRGESSD